MKSSRGYEILREVLITRTAPAHDQRIRKLPQGVNRWSKETSEVLRRLRDAPFDDEPMLRVMTSTAPTRSTSLAQCRP